MNKILAAVAALSSVAIINTASADNIKFCYEEWEPFHFRVDGVHKGVQIELTDKALAAIGHTATYRELPYARCLDGVKKGDFDAMLLTSDEEPLVPTTVATVFWEVGLVARGDWPTDTYSSLSDFDGKKIGMISSYEYAEAITEAAKKWNVKKNADGIANLRKVGAGRLDLTVVDIPWSQLIAKRENLNVRVMSPVLQSYPQFTYFNPDKSAYSAPLSAELQKLIDDGTVDETYKSYLNETFADAKSRSTKTFLE